MAVLYFRTFRAGIGNEQLKLFNTLKAELADSIKPLLRPALEATASVLGARPEDLRRSRGTQREFVGPGKPVVDAEIFTDGRSLIVLSVQTEGSARSARGRRDSPVQQETADATHRLNLGVIGPDWEPGSLGLVKTVAQSLMAAPLSPFFYASERFDELRGEGREPAPTPSMEEIRASELLSDRFVRTLALAIKSSGGLLVRDLPKQLPPEARERVDELTAGLRDHGLLDSEIVVVCSKAQAQVTRAPNRDVLVELSQKGVKCACGRPLAEERMEEALAITDFGRALLDKARWLTILLLNELTAVRIDSSAILVEQSVGGDEIDCLANIDGELALFELKDKEFNLGNAYSFGAKIGIIRPEHPIIVTTERIGNDAKEHFVRARSAGARRDHYVTYDGRYVPYEPDEDQAEITYIEGVSNLRAGIEQFVGSIYRRDAITLLNRVLPVATMNGKDLLRAFEKKMHSPECAADRNELPESNGVTADG